MSDGNLTAARDWRVTSRACFMVGETWTVDELLFDIFGDWLAIPRLFWDKEVCIDAGSYSFFISSLVLGMTVCSGMCSPAFGVSALLGVGTHSWSFGVCCRLDIGFLGMYLYSFSFSKSLRLYIRS